MDLIRLVLAVQVGLDVGRTGWGSRGGASLPGYRQGYSAALDSCFSDSYFIVWGHCIIVGLSSMKTPNHGLVWEAPENKLIHGSCSSLR